MLTAALMAVYSGVLWWNGPTSNHEMFPVFNWQLFSKVPPAVNTSYGIRVLEVDGEAVDPPRYFEESKDIFPHAKSPEAATLIRAFGGHLEAGRMPEVAFVREVLESRYFEPHTSVRYQVVRRRYHVLERVECECYLAEEVMDEFEYG